MLVGISNIIVQFRTESMKLVKSSFVKQSICVGVSLVFSSHFVFADSTQIVDINKIAKQEKITADFALEKIMSDPDWMGASPERPNWSLNSQTIYFQQKAKGHTHRNTLKLDLNQANTIKPKSILLESAEALLNASSASANLSPNKKLGVFDYQGDVYLINLQSEKISVLTKDHVKQSNVSFVNDQTISYFIKHDIYLMDIITGVSSQLASFNLTEDPEKIESKDYLQQSQPRLLDYVSNKQTEKTFQKQRSKKLQVNKDVQWYLGKKQSIKTFRLSPNANWLVLGLVNKELDGKSDNMPEFVTESGYVNNRKVRSLVGTDEKTTETFYLVDFLKHKKIKMDLSKLPGISDDPLASLRMEAAKKIGYKFEPLKGDRAVYAYNWSANQGVEWSDNSEKAAILLFSYDNKDRWIVSFDIKKKAINTTHWLSNEAWVNDSTFNEFGWLPDNQTLYYLSEEDGYSHLYIKNGKRRARQVTKGQFEVSDLTVSDSGENIFYRANKKHPGIHEIYVADLSNRSSEAISNLGGKNDYVLSPDESQIIISHSSLTKMPELYLQPLKDLTQTPKQLTYTMSREFLTKPWQAPEIKAIKSSEVEQPIYSRLYKPIKNTSEKRPAVMFVHGAGYLQNSHQGWSGYFREFMFHNYLTSKGYVVLDMDYRASKGYGRDWRTAIYQNMGTPELQDLKDGAKWLVDNMNVDAKKIGVYGGSYGGFMTFMALFKEPELFAAGAALRPVTDWTHYNHGYTSNILNTPQVDPDAFERSSPIEFASGLNKPLLICHGMVDDNVFFKDSVRLVQKLIELKKTKYFETAIYPVEAHGFREPSSWLDEYTRIDLLFDENLL
ncbi:MAG: dipeptidyl aminopeptidase/acylaminoacyl peptidase [Polaribacter sp.]|jgi:dipeptidyl aminopeptidase/acylaminoacyl peptidase